MIITTHYIEETAQADCIGVLRNTKIVVQQSPQELMQMYQNDSLEDTIVKLSHEQDESMLEMPVWLIEPTEEDGEQDKVREKNKKVDIESPRTWGRFFHFE